MGTMADAPGSLVMRDLGSSEVSGFESRVCVKPAVSISSSKTTHCFGRSVKSVLRFSSFMAGEFKLTM